MDSTRHNEGMDDPLALRLVGTVRAGRTGLTDAFATPASLTAWVREQDLDPYLDPAAFTADEEVRRRIVSLRQAVRALFARAVAPQDPSSADAGVLPSLPEALEQVNHAAAPLVRRLRWREGWVREAGAAVESDGERLAAALANATIDFFAGPLAEQVRVCPAPRCVLYFIRRHPRQEWCSVACGNRARAARFYHQSRTST